MARGVEITDKMLVHPTFLYESLVDFVIFVFLYFTRKNKKFDGSVLCCYLILYGTARFFIEELRTDSLMFLGFRVSKVLSLFLVIVSLLCFVFASIREKDKLEVGEK